MATDSLPNVWVVRADGGIHTDACVAGGFSGIGWGMGDLNDYPTIDDLRRRLQEAHPQDHQSAANTINRFRSEIRNDDFIITPARDGKLYYGRVAGDYRYTGPVSEDNCPYVHRRDVVWETEPLDRQEMSVPLQSSFRSALTVFHVKQRRDFLNSIGILDESHKVGESPYDPYESVLKQILEFTPAEFEELVNHLLAAMGFEKTETVGGSGDRGLDVKGRLSIPGLISVDLFVQAKRYQLGGRVGDRDVVKLRQVIPNGGQGAVITTADFTAKAYAAANESGFAKISLMNGSQLVDLLVENWNNIPEEFRDKLGIRPGLVPA